MNLQRPNSILWFERLYGLSILLSVVDIVVHWDQYFGDDELDNETRSIFTITMVLAVVVIFAAQIALWFFAAHRASKIAKWLLISIAAISLGSWAVDFTGYTGSELVFFVLMETLACLALVFLFRMDARIWFRSGGVLSLDENKGLKDVFD